MEKVPTSFGNSLAVDPTERTQHPLQILNAMAPCVVPIAVTASESVERLRTWASGRCLSADRPGLYRRPEPAAGSRRSMNRKASNN